MHQFPGHRKWNQNAKSTLVAKPISDGSSERTAFSNRMSDYVVAGFGEIAYALEEESKLDSEESEICGILFSVVTASPPNGKRLSARLCEDYRRGVNSRFQ